jgi:hypothetical protein
MPALIRAAHRTTPPSAATTAFSAEYAFAPTIARKQRAPTPAMAAAAPARAYANPMRKDARTTSTAYLNTVACGNQTVQMSAFRQKIASTRASCHPLAVLPGRSAETRARSAHHSAAAFNAAPTPNVERAAESATRRRAIAARAAVCRGATSARGLSRRRDRRSNQWMLPVSSPRPSEEAFQTLRLIWLSFAFMECRRPGLCHARKLFASKGGALMQNKRLKNWAPR